MKKTKTFDAVTWMRKRRAEIDGEDAGLSWQERAQKTLAILEGDPLWEHCKRRHLRRTVTDIGDGGAPYSHVPKAAQTLEVLETGVGDARSNE